MIPVQHLIYKINRIILNTIILFTFTETETINISTEKIYLNEINKKVLMEEIKITVLKNYNKKNYREFHKYIKNFIEIHY